MGKQLTRVTSAKSHAYKVKDWAGGAEIEATARARLADIALMSTVLGRPFTIEEFVDWSQQ